MLRLTADTRHSLTAFETLPHFGAATVLRINVAILGRSDTAFVDRLCADFRPHMVWGQPLEAHGRRTLRPRRALFCHS